MTRPDCASEAWCCCLGMIDNTIYKCLASGLDLGHCGDQGGPCHLEAECRARVAAMPKADQ